MLARLRNWLNDVYSTDEPKPANDLRKTGAYAVAKPKKRPQPKSGQRAGQGKSPAGGGTAKRFPKQNTARRNQYIREDTGTHEKLKIVDNSMLDLAEEDGVDPYNTGSFDRSKNWSSRFSK